jgi:hypothetical protein
VRACSFFACISFACVVTRTSLAPAERRVEGLLQWPCPLDMLESCMFSFVSPPLMHAPLLVRGRRSWSSHVETHFFFSPLFSAPAMHVGMCGTSSTRHSTSNQQPRSEPALICIAPFMPVLLLVHRARLPRSDDNLCRQHRNPRYTYSPYTHSLLAMLSFQYSADLEYFHRFPGAPVS